MIGTSALPETRTPEVHDLGRPRTASRAVAQDVDVEFGYTVIIQNSFSTF
jgi:hypothetical protein